jgi:hypothetical protein
MVVDDFFDLVMPHLPGADEALVRSELLATLREFCEGGLAWDYKYGPVSIAANQTVVTLSQLPDNTKVAYLLRTEFMAYNDDYYRELPPQLTLPMKANDTAAEPHSYFAEAPNSLLLIPTPTTAHPDGFRANLALVPTTTAAVLPDTFATHWPDAIKDGVLYRMFSMPSKPWSAPPLAALHGKSFRNQIKKSRDVVKRRYGMSSGGWRFPYFAAQ